MLSWKDYYLQEQVRQDRIEEAKQQRLVKMLSRKIKDERREKRDLILARIGYRLVLWGDALLRRVDERMATS